MSLRGLRAKTGILAAFLGFAPAGVDVVEEEHWVVLKNG